jgi:hypothetical protein
MVYTIVVFEDQPENSGQDADLEPTEADGGKRGHLVCAACRYRVTGQSDRIAVKDQHEHTYVNPGGFVYHIGCFARAPGCTMVGGPSTELTWFAGYAWVIANCRGCSRHLGWQFLSDSSHFFGLVLDRLAEEDRSD